MIIFVKIMAKVLVTGGAGFIGSQVVDALIQRRHKVVVVDNLSTGRKKNLNPSAVFYQADIKSIILNKIFEKEKPDIVFHYAANIDLRKSLVNPIFDAEENILGSLNLFSVCVKSKVKKIIFASTGGAIYGEQEYFPADEAHTTRPFAPYGVAKLAVEKYLDVFSNVYGIPYVVLRLANVYGPRQNPLGEAGVVAIFIYKLLKGEKVVINGDGKQTRDFVYVTDVVDASLKALNLKKNEVLNIGTGKESSVNRIFEILKKNTNSRQIPVHGPAKKGEQSRSVLDIKKARKFLDWNPEVSLQKGLEKTVEFFKHNRNYFRK